MNPEAIMTVSGAVVALAQLVKWAAEASGRPMPGLANALIVLALSLVGVVLWWYSQAVPFDQRLVFSYFAGWIAVATSAAGIFGFTRVAASAVTRVAP